MTEKNGRRGMIGAWSMRSDGKKWSEFGWSMGRERMDRCRERARKENDVGFLKPHSNGFFEGVLS